MDFESCYCDASWEQDFEGCTIFPDSMSLQTTCTNEIFGGSAADIAHASEMQLGESAVDIADYFSTGSTTMLAPLETMPADVSTLPYPYTYPYQFSGVPCCSVSSSFSHTNFLQGSSVEESPLSSPSSESSKESMWGATGFKGSARDSPLVNYHLQPTCPGVQTTNHFVSNCSTEQPEEPHGVKMPQSKHLSVSCAWFKLHVCFFPNENVKGSKIIQTLLFFRKRRHSTVAVSLCSTNRLWTHTSWADRMDLQQRGEGISLSRTWGNCDLVGSPQKQAKPELQQI